ncbi:MAG: cysteine desulfurase [Candidatus Aenigmatarchaeota archaeon]
MDVKVIRKDFSVLKNTNVIYFDNAATTLTPNQVIFAMNEYYEKYRANIHRGIHKLSEIASKKYEEAHNEIARFLNAKSEEIFITKNTTESINQLAFSLYFSGYLKKGDKIVTTLLEHHSNFLPWLRLKKLYGIELEIIRPNEEGIFNLDDFEKACKDAKLVTIIHVSNVLGSITPVEKICKIAKGYNALVHIDGAQSTPHMEIDVKKIGCDFFSCSAHKFCGPTGIGILYMKKELGEKLEPALLGGGIITKVTLDDYFFTKLPDKWEAGTPNIAGVIGTGEAIKYLKKIGMKNIENYERKLTKNIIEKMNDIPNLEIYGPKNIENRTGVIPFNFKNMHPHDVAGLLNNLSNIAVRSGHHCAMPLHTNLIKRANGTCRASLYFYNTEEEVEIFIKTLKEISKLS